jgi:hypothetical protein
MISGLNSLRYDSPQDDNQALKVGAHSSFGVGEQDDNQALKVGARSSFAVGESDDDSDSESCSSDEVPAYHHRTLSNSGLKNAQGMTENCENGDKTGESLKGLLIPMFENIKVQQSPGPKPRQQKHRNPNLRSINQDTTLTQSQPLTQEYQQQPGNNEPKQPSPQNPQLPDLGENDNLNQTQQHLNQLYHPQQPQMSYPSQGFQFPMQNPHYVQVYSQQVQTPPSPQTPQSQPPQYGPLLIQASPLVTPQGYGMPPLPGTPCMDQQLYVGCQEISDTQSNPSDLPSSSGYSTPIVCYNQPYNHDKLVTPVMIGPVTPHCYPTGQVLTPNLVTPPPPDVLPPTPFLLNNFMSNPNLEGCTIPSNISCNINQMTMQSVISEHPQLKLETASANTHINITPLQHMNMTNGREGGPIWTEDYNYAEYQHEKLSNLYIHWMGSACELKDRLEQKNLEVHNIRPTTVAYLYNVVFNSHSSARKAFTTQRDLQIRMVPPRRSRKNWYRNPSPKFLVQYETKCRLDVREGKAVVHDLVGVLLMSNCKERRGCLIWADQLKGHRIRIVGCVGKFMLPSKRLVDFNEVPKKASGNEPLGWVSYRNRHTREEYVTRKSGNQLKDYIYNG